MALVLENGIWLLQSSTGPQLLEKALTPVSGTPSSIADGATLDATLANGAKVHDPGGHFQAIADDGSKMSLENNTSDECANGSAWALAARIWWPDALIGDVDVEARVKSSSSGGTTQLFMGVGAGNDAGVANEGGIVGIRVGRGVGLAAYAGGQGDIDAVSGTSSVTVTDFQWIRFTIVGETITWYEGGGGATPSYSTFGTAEKWDRAGGARYAYLSIGGTGATWAVTNWKFKGYQRIALP